MRTASMQYQDVLAKNFIDASLPQDERHKRSVKTITLQVTDACNLACTYCYQINKGNHKMTFETAKALINKALFPDENTLDYIGADSVGVVLEFIGGEPLLEIELITQITDYFIATLINSNHRWATRYKVSICSNGVLYFDPRVQAYLKAHKDHLAFNISIDGNKELHDSCRIFPNGKGSYDIAMAGVRHYRDVLKGEMGCKMTLCPANIDKTCEAVISLIDNGYEEINLNCVYEDGWTVEHAKVFYAQLKQLADYMHQNDLYDKVYVSVFNDSFFCPQDSSDTQNWCGGTGSMLACDYDGLIYPCIRYMSSSLGVDIKPIVIGDVYDGVGCKDSEKEWISCLNCITRQSQSTQECLDCPISTGCAWCSGYNYQVTGTPNKRVTYICIMHKARCLANAYFYNQYYISKGKPERFHILLDDFESLKIINSDELVMLKTMSGQGVG